MEHAILSAQGLGKAFGAQVVLSGVDLALAAREVVCVIGPSGSGKTTLLRCLALLETPAAGRIRMRGTVVSEPRPARAVRSAARAVRADIGMVFQQFNLWPHMTVLENVIEAPMRARRTPRDQAVADAERLLAKVGMAEKRDA
ncbi:MAG: amino acid ABC transporter ATP-binding protein, partial [Gemmatimonadaceae bacterium]|nr:amino acid ABC transporter ATP-binding protein [Acetobacteraceae bacterium]